MVEQKKFDLIGKYNKKILLLITIVSLILLLFIVLLGVNTHNKIDEIIREQCSEQKLLLAKQISTGIEEFLYEKVSLIESVALNEPGTLKRTFP